MITLRAQERLRVDSGTLAVAVALRGVGFAIVDQAACRGLVERGELVPIGLDKPAAPLEMYAAYRSAGTCRQRCGRSSII
ncbi:hypothetical protein WM31_26260 [Burkholderia ubonensis]|nr:hypothetical protein WM31_26260 [Burkholderia ubonensis]